MFLNFVFSAACKHKRGGGKQIVKQEPHQSKQTGAHGELFTSQSWGTHRL